VNRRRFLRLVGLAAAAPVAGAAVGRWRPVAAAPAPQPQLTNPSFSPIQPLQGVLTADGLWWSQAGDMGLLDISNGASRQRLVALTQRTTSGNDLIYSNDGGTTWRAAGLRQTGIIRGALAYDPANDVIHACWVATPVDGGVFYRRYLIWRVQPGDTTTAIASITRDEKVNVIFDKAAPDSNSYEHPICLWLNTGGNGTVFCAWGVGSSTAKTIRSEVRCTMRRLSNTSDDNTLANWLAPLNEASGVGATAVINTSPEDGLRWSLLATGSASSAYQSVALIPSSDATYAGDLVIAYCTDTASWRVNRARWSAADADWRSGMAAATLDSGLGTLVPAIGLIRGYDLKHQIGTRIVRDPTSARLFFGYPYWADAAGDRVAFRAFTPDGVADPERVLYDPGGAHSYAPTLDLLWDSTSQRLVAAYCKTGTQHVYTQLWTATGAAADQGETLIYSDKPVDIPSMAGFRVGGKLFLLIRDTLNTPKPPYSGYGGTIDWS